MSDKEAKRNKQAEYARQLQQDNGSGPTQQRQQYEQQHQYQQQPHQALDDNGGGGLGNIGERVCTRQRYVFAFIDLAIFLCRSIESHE